MKKTAIGNIIIIITFVICMVGLFCYNYTETRETKMLHNYGIMLEEEKLKVDMKSDKYYIHRPYKNYLDRVPTTWVEKDSELEGLIEKYENSMDAIMFITASIATVFCLTGLTLVEKKYQ